MFNTEFPELHVVLGLVEAKIPNVSFFDYLRQ